MRGGCRAWQGLWYLWPQFWWHHASERKEWGSQGWCYLPDQSQRPSSKQQNQPQQGVCRAELGGPRRPKTPNVWTGEDTLWSRDNITFTMMLERQWIAMTPWV